MNRLVYSKSIHRATRICSLRPFYNLQISNLFFTGSKLQIASQPNELTVPFEKVEENVRVHKNLPQRKAAVNLYRPTTPIENVPVVLPRLEQYYYNTLAEDLLVLTYDHSSPFSSLDSAKELKEWKEVAEKGSAEEAVDMKELFSTPLLKLPTVPFNNVGPCTNLITKMAAIEPKQPRRSFPKGNPIDFVGKEVFIEKKRQATEKITLSYQPTFEYLPSLKCIEIRIITEAALKNNQVVYSAIMLLTQITGLQAVPLYAERADAQHRIKQGQVIGAIAKLKEQKMYEFMDKLVHTVLPRVRDWKGIVPKYAYYGNLTLNLSSTDMGMFPDIEPHFDMYPKLFDAEVSFVTNGFSEANDVMLLSALGCPVNENAIAEMELESNKETKNKIISPYAEFRKDDQDISTDAAPMRGSIVRKRAKQVN